MIERIDWVSRTFSFNMPVGLFPNILERLRGTPVRIQERVAALPSPLLIQQAGEAWSIQENVGHLLDLETLWAGRVDDFLAGKDTLQPADMTNQKTYQANHNATAISEIIATFRLTRLTLVQRLEGCAEADILRSAHHARLNINMRILDLAYFVAEHDDHHLAEITALIHKLSP